MVPHATSFFRYPLFPFTGVGSIQLGHRWVTIVRIHPPRRPVLRRQPATLESIVGDNLTFLKNFLRHPTSVGAIAPSSPALVEKMVEWFDWATIRNVVEFGPGTGVFTQAIVERLHPEAKFFAIEQSADMVRATRNRCPGTTVIQDSVTNVRELCRQQSMDHVDAVICGLPWASFSDSLQSEIMDAMLEVLPSGGRFATFAYWQGLALPAGIRFARRLEKTFSSVEKSPTAWMNLPPAFVYRCVR